MLPKKHVSEAGTSATGEEYALPIQNFDQVSLAESVMKNMKNSSLQRKTSDGLDFKAGLHLHGDLSTNRPGHFKRWDSEARIGGGHGVEEVEDRI